MQLGPTYVFYTQLAYWGDTVQSLSHTYQVSPTTKIHLILNSRVNPLQSNGTDVFFIRYV